MVGPQLRGRSMASLDATPSMRRKHCLVDHGQQDPVDREAGSVIDPNDGGPIRSPSFMVVSKVSSLVSSPQTASTSCITGGGLKKCMPITLSCRCTHEAIFVMEIDDVLEARIVAGGQSVSSSLYKRCLMEKSSTIASMMKSAFSNAPYLRR